MKTLAILFAAVSSMASAQDIKLTQPYRVMYGFSDGADLKIPNGPWLTRELWENTWNEVFKHVNVITGKTKDAALVKRLRSEGKVFAYHVTNTLDATHKTSEDLVNEWTKPYQNTLDGDLPGGFDAISIDELHSSPDGTEESEITIHALRELRRRFPHKIIVTWAMWKMALSGSEGPNGKRFTPGKFTDHQMQAAADCSDLLIIECYHREANPHFALFSEMAENVNKRMPGLLRKSIFALGICESPGVNYADVPGMDFGAFLEKQFEIMKSTDTLRQMRGVGFWAFYRAKPEFIPTVNRLIEQYYPSPK